MVFRHPRLLVAQQQMVAADWGLQREGGLDETGGERVFASLIGGQCPILINSAHVAGRLTVWPVCSVLFS